MKLSFSKASVNKSAKGEKREPCPTPLMSVTHQRILFTEQVFRAVLLLTTSLPVSDIHPTYL